MQVSGLFLGVEKEHLNADILAADGDGVPDTATAAGATFQAMYGTL